MIITLRSKSNRADTWFWTTKPTRKVPKMRKYAKNDWQPVRSNGKLDRSNGKLDRSNGKLDRSNEDANRPDERIDRMKLLGDWRRRSGEWRYGSGEWLCGSGEWLNRVNQGLWVGSVGWRCRSVDRGISIGRTEVPIGRTDHSTDSSSDRELGGKKFRKTRFSTKIRDFELQTPGDQRGLLEKRFITKIYKF